MQHLIFLRMLLAYSLMATLTLGEVTPSSSLKECGDGVECLSVSPVGTDLNFDCHFMSNSEGHVGEPVFLLHGFPEWSGMYVPLMKFLADKGVRSSYACNQRGYSPDASPGTVEVRASESGSDEL